MLLAAPAVSVSFFAITIAREATGDRIDQQDDRKLKVERLTGLAAVVAVDARVLVEHLHDWLDVTGEHLLEGALGDLLSRCFLRAASAALAHVPIVSLGHTSAALSMFVRQ